MRRSLFDQLTLEETQHDRIALDLDDDAASVVEREAAQPSAGREPLDERPNPTPWTTPRTTILLRCTAVVGRHRVNTQASAVYFQVRGQGRRGGGACNLIR